MEPISPHSPSFGYYKPSTMNIDVIAKRDELFKDKISNIKKKWEDNKIKFIDDISITYANLHKPSGITGYIKVFY